MTIKQRPIADGQRMRKSLSTARYEVTTLFAKEAVLTGVDILRCLTRPAIGLGRIAPSDESRHEKLFRNPPKLWIAAAWRFHRSARGNQNGAASCYVPFGRRRQPRIEICIALSDVTKFHR